MPITPPGPATDSFQVFIDKLNVEIISPLIYLFTALAILYFSWGMYKYVKNAANPKERETGNKHIMFGVLGLALMALALTIVHIVANTVGATI